MSDLHAAAREYLAIRRALGFKLRGHDRLLTDFIVFLAAADAPTITSAAAVAWATRPAGLQPVRYAQRLCIVRGFAGYVRGFAGYVHALDAEVEVPPLDLLPYRRYRRMPHLYSQTEIEALISATASLRPPLRAATYRAVFGLLAVTGMRVGEVIALDDEDVDLRNGVLEIREAKFGKTPPTPSACHHGRGVARIHHRPHRVVRAPTRIELLRVHPRHPVDLPLRARHVRPVADPRRDNNPARRQRPQDPWAAAQLRGGHAAGLVPRRGRRRGDAPGPVGLHGSRPSGLHVLVPLRRAGPTRPGSATSRAGCR